MATCVLVACLLVACVLVVKGIYSCAKKAASSASKSDIISKNGFTPLANILWNKEVANHVVIQALWEVLSQLQQLHRGHEVSNRVALNNVQVLVSRDFEVQNVKLVNRSAAPLAPEVANGGSTTPASDIYALGELVGECLLLNRSYRKLPLPLCHLRRQALKENPRDRLSIIEARDYVAAALRRYRTPRSRLDM